MGVLVVSLTTLSGCGDDPVSPPFSVEVEINANLPYTGITVSIDGSDHVFTTSGGAGSSPFESAIAERGLLILTMPDGNKTVFNLSTACSIDILEETLVLRY